MSKVLILFLFVIGFAAVSVEAQTKTDPPKFKEGAKYSDVRAQMIEAGWIPFRSKASDICSGEDERCNNYPEMEACAGTGLGNCRYLWKKDSKTVVIFTIGESPVYNGQDLLKAEQMDAADRDDTTFRGGAVVHTPPTNIRQSPDGKILCVIKEKKQIIVDGTTNISDKDGEWIMTKACGKPGVVHTSQIVMAN